MPDVRDPVWQFIGLIIGSALALGIPLAGYLAARRAKRIAIDVVGLIPLVRARPEVAQRLALQFDGQNVTDAHVALIRVRNAGQVPIPASDYERPLAINVNAKARVIAALVNDAQPLALQPSLTTESQRAILQPLLLNAGDMLTLTIVTSGAPAPITVDGRIVGVKAIGVARPPWWLSALGYVYVVGPLLFLVAGYTASSPESLALWAVSALIWGTLPLLVARRTRSFSL